MDWFELREALEGQVADVGLLHTDELGEQAHRFHACLPRHVVLVEYSKVDRFEEDRVVAVILVHMLRDFDVFVDALDLAIDGREQLLVVDRRREKLQDLKQFDLQPRARCHIIEVVLSVFLHIGQNCHELRDQTHKVLMAKDFNRSLEERAG